MRTCMLAIACGLAACATTTAAGVAERNAPKIRYVVVTGNHALDDATILAGLATHAPEGTFRVTYYRYDPLAVQLDRDRIETLYQRSGYFSARVADVEVRDLGEDRVGVEFDIDEGEPTRVSRLDVTGTPARFERPKALRDTLHALRPGAVFGYDDYDQAKRLLKAALLDQGYAHAEVNGTVEVDRERRSARISLRASPGPLAHFGTIQISGLGSIPESVVRNRIAWEPGDVYSPAKLETTRGQLYNLGLFSSVRTEIDRQGQPPVVDVDVVATAGNAKEVRLGGGFAADDTYFEGRVLAAYLVHGFVDPRLTLRLNAQPAYRVLRSTSTGGLGGVASVALDRVDFLAPLVTGSAIVALGSDEYEAYTVRGPTVRASVTRPFFGERLQLSAGWQLSYFNLSDVSPAITPAVASQIGAVEPYRLGFFDQRVALDLRDNILLPRKGLYALLQAEEAGAVAGSLFGYVRLLGDLRGYVPITDWVVIASRVQAGSAVTGNIPLTQRFFSGGATSHRGFNQRHLSPFVQSGDEIARIGGNALFLATLEVRTRIARISENWLSVAAFTDGGDVTLETSELDLANLNWAIGGGLRYMTLIGPVRFDAGYRLNRYGPGNPDPGDRWAFHVSIGGAF
jgi:translocation and assembly module TamA